MDKWGGIVVVWDCGVDWCGVVGGVVVGWGVVYYFYVVDFVGCGVDGVGGVFFGKYVCVDCYVGFVGLLVVVCFDCEVMVMCILVIVLVLLVIIFVFVQQVEWIGFYGDKMVQKYLYLIQIMLENVGQLEKVWELYIGDVLNGKGDIFGMVWFVMFIVVNDMVYIGMLFYCVIVFELDIGCVKWIYDLQILLKVLIQFELKNCGVIYWVVSDGLIGICFKWIYLGMMIGQIYVLDVDIGELCQDFGEGGILDVNQWNCFDVNFLLL